MDARYLDVSLPGKFHHPNVRLRLTERKQHGDPATEVVFHVGEMDEIEKSVVLAATRLKPVLDAYVRFMRIKDWREVEKTVQELVQSGRLRCYRVSLVAEEDRELADQLRAYRCEEESDGDTTTYFTSQPPAQTAQKRPPLAHLHPVEMNPISFKRLWHFAEAGTHTFDLAPTQNPHHRKTGHQYIGRIEEAVVLLDVPENGWDCVMSIVDLEVINQLAAGRSRILSSAMLKAWREEWLGTQTTERKSLDMRHATTSGEEGTEHTADTSVPPVQTADGSGTAADVTSAQEKDGTSATSSSKQPDSQEFGATIGERIQAKKPKDEPAN